MYGYAGRILRVNLSDGSIETSVLPETLIENYLGGKGFGRYLLSEETKPGIDPLGPDNKLIFTVGPAAGTILPTATRFMVTARSPLTGAAVDSYCGGSWGHALKLAGYDVVIIAGMSRTPIMLIVDNDRIRIEPVSDLWGKDVYQTEDLLRKQLGDNSSWKIVSIGPAGENKVRYAAIAHNKYRHLGRSGAGAVMGSKNLKAIAVRGTNRPQVYNESELKSYVKELNCRIKKHPATGHNYPVEGTPVMVAVANAAGTFPSKNWQNGEVPHVEKIDSDALARTRIRQGRCLGCTIGCAHISRIEHPKFGLIEIDGPEYETIYAFGGLCMVDNIEDIIALNSICDQLGLDTISCGATVAFAMEAYERGDLELQEPLNWGDTERIAGLIEDIAYCRRDGVLLAEGSARVAKKIGVDYAVHVKGLEPAGYDPRGLKSMALTYAVSSRGATHLTTNAYSRDISGKPRPHEVFGQEVSLSRLAIDYKADLVYNMMNFNTIADCFILCRFLNRDLMTWEEYSEIIYLITGRTYTVENLETVSERINTLNRLYNQREGFTKTDDFLPTRWSRGIRNGNSQGAYVSSVEMEQMLLEYYTLRGWDENGVPKPETLIALGLNTL